MGPHVSMAVSSQQSNGGHDSEVLQGTHVARPHTGISLGVKRGEALTLTTAWMDLEHMVLSERTSQKGHPVCESLHGITPQQTHPQGQEVDSWMSGVGEGARGDC